MLNLFIPHKKAKGSRKWQEEKSTLTCLIAEGGGVELYEEGGEFASNF